MKMVGITGLGSPAITNVPLASTTSRVDASPVSSKKEADLNSPNYASTTATKLSVDSKTKIDVLAHKIVDAVSKGDERGAAALVQGSKAFIDSYGVSDALSNRVKALTSEKKANEQGLLEKYGDLIFLAARAVIEGLNHRQSDTYWSSLQTALKAASAPVTRPGTVVGLAE
jgi:hypothetical protein